MPTVKLELHKPSLEALWILIKLKSNETPYLLIL